MRSRKAVEIFVGLSAVALTSLSPAVAQLHHHASGPAALTAEGGEGGEGGESGTSATADTDLDLLLVLAQMQGHLLVAQELLLQGQVAAAEPHVGHPVDELYGAIAPALQQRRIAPFLSSLESLRQQVRLDPSSAATGAKLKLAQQAVDRASAAVMRGLPQPSPSVPTLVKQLAQVAVSEYGTAVASDRIVEVIEYQDARGFLLQAQQLLASARRENPGDQAQLTVLEQKLQPMLRGFPGVMPPGKVVLTVEQMRALQEAL